MSIDLSTVHHWENCPEEGNIETASSDNLVVEVLLVNGCSEIVQAKERETANLADHDVFTEVDDVGQSTIGTWWILTEKIKGGEKCIKARLVAKGFQETNKESIRCDSATSLKEKSCYGVGC